MIRLLIFALVFVSMTVSAQRQRQGIRGQINWISGNQMPGPGVKLAPALGVQREVFVYELVALKDCTTKDGLFVSIPARLVTTFLSRPDGSFKIKLPTGKYSVFVKEPKGLYANSYDGNGFINPVSVIERRFSPLTILINYEAAY